MSELPRRSHSHQSPDTRKEGINITTIIQKKICLLGDFAVGKSSLMRRYVEGKFDDRYLSTIGVKISRKTVLRPYGQLNLLLWDMTGGDEIGTQTRASYLRGAACALVVCDLTRRETLAVFDRYTQQMRLLNPQTNLVLIGNKVDLTSERVISTADLQTVSTAMGSDKFFLTSAKTGEMVEEAFLYLAEKVEGQS